MTGPAIQTPTRRRDRPLWAEMLGAPETPWEAWPAGGGSLAVFEEPDPAGEDPSPAYLLGTGVIDAEYLGEYDDRPAWYIARSGANGRILFHSKSIGKWVLKDDFLEPLCWTRTLLAADGTTVKHAYGDSWWESESIAIASGGKIILAPAGVQAEEPRGPGDPAPEAQKIEIGCAVWINVDGGATGEYLLSVGTGAPTVRVGHWSWEVDEGDVWAMDPGDRTQVVPCGSGAAAPCPQGMWTVRAGEGGAWVADLSEAAYGADLECEWVPDDPQDPAAADGDAPEVAWAGLAAVPMTTTWIYQPSRFG